MKFKLPSPNLGFSWGESLTRKRELGDGGRRRITPLAPSHRPHTGTGHLTFLVYTLHGSRSFKNSWVPLLTQVDPE